MKRLLLLLAIPLSVYSQNIGINTQNPDASAALEVQSTDAGILIPRMSEAQRNLIVSPATGLLVYQIDGASGFYFFDGSAWTSLSGNTTSSNTGLEQVTEGGNTGYRLIGRDTANYGNIGSEAIDLSYSASPSTSAGAGGDYSIAIGQNTTASGYSSATMGYYTDASGNFSTAMGSFTTASGQVSTAMGIETEASGNFSTAMGDDTDASGDFSTAMGRATTASGFASTAIGNSTVASGYYSIATGDFTEASGAASTAMGSGTVASGDFSTAMGYNTEASGDFSTATGGGTNASGDYSTATGVGTTAPSYAETSIGLNNTDYTPIETTSWNTGDRLFVIGNGQSSSLKSDAMIVYKDGNTIINGALTLSNGSNSITLPNTDGTAGQVLTTDGTGNVSFQNAPSFFNNMQGGTTSVGSSGGADFKEVTITFPTPFSNTPTIVGTVVYNNINYGDMYIATLKGYNNAQCVFRIERIDNAYVNGAGSNNPLQSTSWGADLKLNWMAFE